MQINSWSYLTNMMKRSCFSTFYLLCLLVLSAACGEEEKKIQELPFLEVKTTAVGFDAEGSESREISVSSNVEWRAETRDDGKTWCHPRREEDRLVITVDASSEKESRQTEVTVIAEQLQKKVTVSQLGWGKAILLSSDKETTLAIGGAVTVEVTTNVQFKYTLPEGCDWIKQAGTRSVEEHPVVSTPVTFVVSPNKSDEERKAEIVFSDADENSELQPVTFTLVQKGTGEYEPVDPDEIKDDIRINVIGGTASSFQPGGEIEKSFDGDKKTIYHSKWDNTGENYFPITLEYSFAQGSDMDYFVYYPRTDGWNGLFKEVDIEVKNNANTRGVDEWVKVMTYDFKGSSGATRVDFPQPQIGVSAIRFTVRSGAGDGQGFASCAEMEFYKKNPANFDWSTLFADPSCSELKPGITEQEIFGCTHSFFKNIAYYMYIGRYSREFRINTFRAYPHPDIQAKENKTSPYSLLDNPTGISVSTGEQLVVMVGDLKGEKLSLRVQDLNKPEGDGFGGANYPLATGINKLEIEKGGLAYLMYHTPNYKQASPVTVHFATGDVNGYFDSQNPSHEGRANELLANATSPYFDVLGKYAHLTFPTSRFRNHTKDLKKLIDSYDQIVYNEQMLMGLEKYGKMFRNRMYFNVIYTSYMYATSYHTAYNDNTLSELCDESKLTTGSVWGPAHEVGHCNQTRPGLKWLGTTEVTNNIFAQYVQTTVFGQPSRLQTENMGDKESPNRYSKAWNNIVVGGIPHAQEGDVFCKLVPFWQLELYFGKVKDMTPLKQPDKGGFYPEVFEHVRTNPDLPNNGAQQLEFVYIACKAAKMNLLDFFEKWGFLRPVDMEIDDYGKGQITVTEAQADELRKRVEALGYPKPGDALEYITDNTVEVFRNHATVVAGTASRSDAQLTMQNWQNVVAYEVRENNEHGRLICVSDGVLAPSSTASFSVRGGWQNTYKVYAVSYDGKRTEVVFV